MRAGGSATFAERLHMFVCVCRSPLLFALARIGIRSKKKLRNFRLCPAFTAGHVCLFMPLFTVWLEPVKGRVGH